jgi:hypothetical protein
LHSFGYDQGVVANLLVMKDFTLRFQASPFQQGALSEPVQYLAISLDLSLCIPQPLLYSSGLLWELLLVASMETQSRGVG